MPGTSADSLDPAASSLAGFTAPTRAGGVNRRIGDVIVDFGFASREAVERAVEHARDVGTTTGQALCESGAVTPDQLARAQALGEAVEDLLGL